MQHLSIPGFQALNHCYGPGSSVMKTWRTRDGWQKKTCAGWVPAQWWRGWQMIGDCFHVEHFFWKLVSFWQWYDVRWQWDDWCLGVNGDTGSWLWYVYLLLLVTTYYILSQKYLYISYYLWLSSRIIICQIFLLSPEVLVGDVANDRTKLWNLLPTWFPT